MMNKLKSGRVCFLFKLCSFSRGFFGFYAGSVIKNRDFSCFMSKELQVLDGIKSKIHTIRRKRVMLDSDLAELYGVENKSLNQAVKRNIDRFPERYSFKLSEEEFEFLRSQIVTANSDFSKKRFSPRVFTEQGVAMLSSVLKSKKAIKINIFIMDVFVELRNTINNNINNLQKFQQIDQKFITYDKQFEELFKTLQHKTLPEKGIFFNGQVFDAFVFISKLIKKAEKNIILFDNYVNEDTLNLLSDKKEKVTITIYTKNISEKLNLAVNKFNEQYQHLEIIQFDKSHDRFLIIDDEIYHVGASLKDLGKKWFIQDERMDVPKTVCF